MSKYRTDASMKCVCGYEYEEILDDSYEIVTRKGDEEFIKIEGSFHVVEKRYDYDERINTVKLFACPKCGTVRMYMS